jgi:anti-anti-sigma factor
MEFRTDEIDNDLLILAADGGLSSDTAEQFVAQIERLVDAGLRKIIVDCAHLDYVSSMGLSVLVRLHGRMKKHGGEVKIAGIRGLPAQVLAFTRLNKLFEIYPDVNRARLAFRAKAV